MIFTADMVKALREKTGLTQEAFSKKINCGTRSVARWEKQKLVRMSAAVRTNLIKLYKKHMEA